MCISTGGWLPSICARRPRTPMSWRLPVCSPKMNTLGCWRQSTDWPWPWPTAVSAPRRPMRTCTPQSSADCWNGSVRWGESCAPGAAAMIRWPPYSPGSTCVPPPTSSTPQWHCSRKPCSTKPTRMWTRRPRGSHTCNTRSRCRSATNSASMCTHYNGIAICWPTGARG